MADGRGVVVALAVVVEGAEEGMVVRLGDHHDVFGDGGDGGGGGSAMDARLILPREIICVYGFI